MKKQIDGWCAWHPQKGFDIEYSGTWDEGLNAFEQEILRSLGWQIKPVRIVDASDNSQEVVVPRAFLTEDGKPALEAAYLKGFADGEEAASKRLSAKDCSSRNE